jgi:hypothetical protein
MRSIWGKEVLPERIRRQNRWLAVGVIAILGLVLLLMEWPSGPRDLPPALGPLALREVIRGGEAQSLVNKMHGKGVAPKENAVGTYRSQDGSADVYVSFYDDVRIPILQFERMADLLRYRPLEFSNLRRKSVQGVDVCECEDMGKPQYFFAYNRGLYWMSATESVAPRAIEDLVRNLKSQ